MEERGVQFRLLGDVGITIDGQARTLAGRRQRELLALLVLEHGTELSADRIADELWGESLPRTARNSVQRFVADLRRALGDHAHRLATGATGYRLDLDRAECDLFLCEDLVAEARSLHASGDLEAASNRLRQASAIRTGTTLGGVGDLAFAERWRVTFDELMRTADEDRFEVELALGRHAELVPEIAEFVANNPYRERAWSQYLIALYRCGRQQEALLAFDRARLVLVEELGVEPSPALAEVHRQILDHAPELAAPERVAGEADISRPPRPEPSLPSPLERAREVPLAGRQAELAVVNRALRLAADGRAQTVILRGEPGIGKTRLAAEAARLARHDGFTVAYGRSDESLRSPYRVWVEALDGIRARLSPAARRRHEERFGSTIGPLVPEQSSVLDRHRKPPNDADPTGSTNATLAPGLYDSSLDGARLGHDPLRLFDATLALIESALEVEPLMIVLDDLQWADESALQLLDHVARRVSGPAVVVLSYRSTSLDPTSRLVELAGRLSPLPSVHEIDLVGLGANDLERVIERLGGATADEQLAISVRDHTNGNPFFATEVLRHWMATRQGGGEGEGVPPTAQRVVQHRVARLGEGLTETLQAASVFGRDFELDLLAHLLRADEIEVLRRLEIALADGLIVDSSEGIDRFHFTHDLLHQALYGDLSQSRRARLHLGAADAVEALYPDADRAGEVARQLLAADDPRVARRLADAAETAGEVAAAALAPAAAADWFTVALEQLDLLEVPDLRARASLMVRLGAQQAYARRPGFRDTLLAAGSLADSIGDIDTLVAACLANTRGTFANVWEVDREAVALLKRAVEATQTRDPATRAHLLAALASEEWDLDHATILERHRRSIELARTSGDAAVLADCKLRLARARGCYLDIDAHMEVNEDVRSLSDQHGGFGPTTMVNLHVSELQVALQSANAEAFHRAVAAITALRETMSLPFAENGVRLLEVTSAGLAGDPDRYEALAVELLAYNLERGDSEAFYLYEAHILYARWMQGRTIELFDEIDRIVAERPDAELYQSVRAMIRHENGDDATAAEALATARERGFVVGRNVFVVQSLGIWGEVAAGLRDRAAAAELYELLAPFRGQFLGNMSQLLQPADLTLGRLALTLGDHGAARNHLERSQQIAADFQAAWMQARTSLFQGELALLDGSDRSVAVSHLNTTARLAESGAYRSLLRDARALLAVRSDPSN